MQNMILIYSEEGDTPIAGFTQSAFRQ